MRHWVCSWSVQHTPHCKIASSFRANWLVRRGRYRMVWHLRSINKRSSASFLFFHRTNEFQNVLQHTSVTVLSHRRCPSVAYGVWVSSANKLRAPLDLRKPHMKSWGGALLRFGIVIENTYRKRHALVLYQQRNKNLADISISHLRTKLLEAGLKAMEHSIIDVLLMFLSNIYLARLGRDFYCRSRNTYPKPTRAPVFLTSRSYKSETMGEGERELGSLSNERNNVPSAWYQWLATGSYR